MTFHYATTEFSRSILVRRWRAERRVRYSPLWQIMETIQSQTQILKLKNQVCRLVFDNLVDFRLKALNPRRIFSPLARVYVLELTLAKC